MATKTDKAVKRAFLRGKKQGKVREEKHVLGLLVAIIVVLLWLLLAQHFGWWPYSRPKLGTAFYTNVSAATPAPAATTASTGSSSSPASGASSAQATGSAGSSGSSSGTSSSGSGSSGSSGTSPIATFAAGVNVGNTEAQTSAQASGLSQNCSVVASASTSANGLGQQQVCIYTQGDKLVTVTYLNGQVISASKSGF